MMRLLPRFVHRRWFAVLSVVTLLGGCHFHPPVVERPNPPPVLHSNVLSPTGKPDLEEVRRFQSTLLDYITYLEQYYISIGVYYGAETKIPTGRRVVNDHTFQCRVIDHLFKDIELPPPPKAVNKEIESTMNKLIDHIVDLRHRIRENNTYMAYLREKYKECK